MVGCLVLQVLESTVTPELEGFFSVCVFADSCAAGWICRVLETNAKRPSMSPTSHWQWILFWRQLEPERPAEEDWMRKGETGGEIFPARTRCSGTVSPGSCLGPVEEEGGCVFVCVCGGGGVCGQRDKVALRKGLWEDRASVGPVMLWQGRVTHKHTQSPLKQVQRGNQVRTHTHKHTEEESSLPWGLIMAGQDVEGPWWQRRRVENRRREYNRDIMVSIRAVGWEQWGRERKSARREAKQTTLR